MTRIRYRRHHYSKEHTFTGTGDVIRCDFVTDPTQGFRVPARSLFIENRGGGAGQNIVYFQTSDDGISFSEVVSLLPDQFRSYTPDDGMVIISLIAWTSNANCQVCIDATPGLWTYEEFREYVPTSIIQKLEETLDSSPSPLAEVDL